MIPASIVSTKAIQVSVEVCYRMIFDGRCGSHVLLMLMKMMMQITTLVDSMHIVIIITTDAATRMSRVLRTFAPFHNTGVLMLQLLRMIL